MAKHSDDYEVGYGKPPQAQRFQKGKSGNPGGRPRGDKTLATEVEKALGLTVPGFRNGKRHRKSVRGIIAANLAKKAAEGNLGAVALIDKIESRKAPREAASSPTSRTLPAPPDGEFGQYEVTLLLEEAPIRRPDFIEGVDIELLRDDLAPDLRAAIEEMVRLKEFLMANAHRFPSGLKGLID